MKRQKFTLDEARATTRVLQLPLDENYYALDSRLRERVWDLMRSTNWKQSPSSKATGRSKGYAFWLALQRTR